MLTRFELARHIRRHIAAELYDESGVPPAGIAIYALSDPRDLRRLRYVGQTINPSRRFLQHLSTARLWLPDDRPWWIKSPKLRPLYLWIRDLYRDEFRMPTMVISGWVEGLRDARLAERSRIYECLARQLPLLNVETENLGRQIPLT